MSLREDAVRYGTIRAEMRAHDAYVAKSCGGDLGKLTTAELLAQKARVAECGVLSAGFPARMTNARGALVRDMFVRHGVVYIPAENTEESLLRLLRSDTVAGGFVTGERTTCTGCGDVGTERVRSIPQPLLQCVDMSDTACTCVSATLSTCAPCWAKSVSEQLDARAVALVRGSVAAAGLALTCGITCVKCGTQGTCLFRATAVPPVHAPPAVVLPAPVPAPALKPKPPRRRGLHAGTSVSVPPPPPPPAPAWSSSAPAIASPDLTSWLSPQAVFGTDVAFDGGGDDGLEIVPLTLDAEFGSNDMYTDQSSGAAAPKGADAHKIRQLDVNATEHIRGLGVQAIATLVKLRELIDRRTVQNDTQVGTCAAAVARLTDRIYAIRIEGAAPSPAAVATTRPRKRGRCSSCHEFGHVITNCPRTLRASALKAKTG